MYINMKFDEINLRGLKFSTTVNDNDNIINSLKYQYIRAVYLISYIQYDNGTDTAFHRTHSVHCSSLVNQYLGNSVT